MTTSIAEAEEAPTSYANCGKGEELDVKLKTCLACKPKDCGDCQILPQQEEECRKRADELHDEALFRQPAEREDCPICFLPLPSLELGQLFMPCCGKVICMGCRYAHELQTSCNATCPFCRAKTPSADKECIEMMKKRVDGNDVEAICQLGNMYLFGDESMSIKKDIDKAIILLHRAAELGSAEAYHNLGVFYINCGKNEMKAKQYFEKAAMAGSTSARFSLGLIEFNAGSFDRAIKHWLMAASGGYIIAVDNVKKALLDGNATRDQYAQALRGYQLYLDEIRSDNRDRAAAYNDDWKYLYD